eukprot:2476862-Amphidinium_carterae.1
MIGIYQSLLRPLRRHGQVHHDQLLWWWRDNFAGGDWQTGKSLKPTALDKTVYRLHHQWNKFPGPQGLRSKVFTSPYCSLVLPDGQDAWLRVDDGFIQSTTPYESVPLDVDPPDEAHAGIWEEKVN